MKRLSMLLTVCCLLSALSLPAHALEYTIGAPEDYLFGQPTSDETVYITTDESANTDRSKAAARIPPSFGSPTSYTLNSGELLTPNLVGQGASSGMGVSGGVTVMPPSVNADGPTHTGPTASAGYTEVTDDLYYSGGHLGTLKIPDLGLTVKVYQGTGSSVLKKGAGHFADTSVWDGNAAFAGHNRGVANHFGKLHTLDLGDRITYTTRLGTRTYEVYSVTKIAVDDLSVLEATNENIITLITCVQDQPDYRWCVRASEV